MPDNLKRKETSINIPEWQRKVKRLHILAWIIWSMAMVAQLINTMHRVGAAAAVDRIMADFNITASTVGAIMSLYFWIYAAMQFPSGLMADYIGPRKVITTGCLVASLGSFIFGIAPSVPFLYLGRILISLGVSVTYVSVLKLTVNWFQSKHFAKLVGLNGFISTIGSLIGTTPMAILITTIGWRMSFEVIAVVNFVVLILCWFIIRNKPSDLKLPAPDRTEPGARHHTQSTGEHHIARASLSQKVKFVLTGRHVWMTFLIGMGLYGTTLVILGAWGIPYLMQVYNMTRSAAADMMSIILISHVIGIIAIPIISDRIKMRKPPILIFSILYFISLLIIIFWNGGKPPQEALLGLFIGLGLFSGTTTLSYVVAKENMPAPVSGLTLGIVNISTFLSAAIFQMLVGLVLDARWEGEIIAGARVYPLSAYQWGFMLILIPALAAVIGAFLLRETRCRDIN